MHTIQTLDLNDARTIIDAGIAEAERIGNPMNIAVVDAGGCLLAFARMDDACLLYTSPSPRDRQKSRMPSSA